MAKFKALNGIAHNLAVSFISPHPDLLDYIETLPKRKTASFSIDLLAGTTDPEELNADIVRKSIQRYQQWFFEEIEKAHIERIDIGHVSLQITLEWSKLGSRHYTCIVSIKTREGKTYSRKCGSSYS